MLQKQHSSPALRTLGLTLQLGLNAKPLSFETRTAGNVDALPPPPPPPPLLLILLLLPRAREAL